MCWHYIRIMKHMQLVLYCQQVIILAFSSQTFLFFLSLLYIYVFIFIFNALRFHTSYKKTFELRVSSLIWQRYEVIIIMRYNRQCPYKKRTFAPMYLLYNSEWMCYYFCLHAHCIPPPPVLDARVLSVINREQCHYTLATTTQRNVNKKKKPDGHVYCAFQC